MPGSAQQQENQANLSSLDDIHKGSSHRCFKIPTGIGCTTVVGEKSMTIAQAVQQSGHAARKCVTFLELTFTPKGSGVWSEQQDRHLTAQKSVIRLPGRRK